MEQPEIKDAQVLHFSVPDAKFPLEYSVAAQLVKQAVESSWISLLLHLVHVSTPPEKAQLEQSAIVQAVQDTPLFLDTVPAAQVVQVAPSFEQTEQLAMRLEQVLHTGLAISALLL